MYTQFVKEAPAGYIPRDDFCQLADIMGIRDRHLCDLLFRAIDTDCDGRIMFVELLKAMSIMTRGDSQEKLKCNFFPFLHFFFRSSVYIRRDLTLCI